jgi:hypothetical protein
MNRRLLLLSSVAVVLAAVLVLDRAAPPGAVEPPPPPEEAVSPTAPDAGTPLNPLQGLVPERYAAMVERPLFNPGRAPRALEEAAMPAPAVAETLPDAGPLGPRAEDFKLVAISSGPSGHVAALRIAATSEVLYLREGQPVQSWTVMKISDTSVVIGSEQGSIELSLFPGGASAAMPAPAAGMDTPLPEEIEDANDAYHAATGEMDPNANTEIPQ